jgi:hypothetical protein
MFPSSARLLQERPRGVPAGIRVRRALGATRDDILRYFDVLIERRWIQPSRAREIGCTRKLLMTRCRHLLCQLIGDECSLATGLSGIGSYGRRPASMRGGSHFCLQQSPTRAAQSSKRSDVATWRLSQYWLLAWT